MIWRLPFLLVVATMLLGACAGGPLATTPPGNVPPAIIPPTDVPPKPLPPEGTPPPVATLPAGTHPMARGPVYADEVSLLQMESYPVQVVLLVRGSLPTPCHEVKWEIVGPDARGRIDVTLFSQADPSMACIQVLEPFEVSIPLGSYATGSFTVWLNGEQVGEFSL
jgi:hypothetical protein